jgi:hypothetical protein
MAKILRTENLGNDRRLVYLSDGTVALVAKDSPLDPGSFLTSERSQAHTVVLSDDNDGIIIKKSGAPWPSRELLNWLMAECQALWRFRDDGVFNLHFTFDDLDDAARFRQRWGD